MPFTSTEILKKMLIVFLIFAGLYFARDFLIPFSVGAVLATLFLPFCKWMEKRKVPRGLAALICLLLVLSFVAGVFALIGWQISEFSGDIVMVKQKVGGAFNRVQEYIYNHLGVSIEEQWQILRGEESSITRMMQSLAGSLTYIFTACVLILAYVFLLLYYRTHIKDFILRLFPAHQREETEDVIRSAARVSQQYLVGLAKMIGCLWIMYGIGFSIVGIRNPVFYAILCGLLEIVPFIGNITGTAITLMVSAVHGASISMLIGVAGTYGGVQFIQGWVLEPLILGPQVKINPLFTILVLVVGELIWGIPGIILAIPLTAMIKIVCDHIPALTPYGFLIGDVQSRKKVPGIIERIRKSLQRRSGR